MGREHNRRGGKAEAGFVSGLCSPFVPHIDHSHGTVAQTAPHNRLLGEEGTDTAGRSGHLMAAFNWSLFPDPTFT